MVYVVTLYLLDWLVIVLATDSNMINLCRFSLYVLTMDYIARSVKTCSFTRALYNSLMLSGYILFASHFSRFISSN